MSRGHKNDPEREIKRRAQRFANPGCGRCHGGGIIGRQLMPDGSTQPMICMCAYGGFPELKKQVKETDGKGNVSPR